MIHKQTNIVQNGGKAVWYWTHMVFVPLSNFNVEDNVINISWLLNVISNGFLFKCRHQSVGIKKRSQPISSDLVLALEQKFKVNVHELYSNQI